MNLDASPTLRIQRMPLLGNMLVPKARRFPESVIWGDISRGLPVETGSCKAVFASHVLEHLSREDYERALLETYRILQPGGRFRMIVPDLAALAKTYLTMLAEGREHANDDFMRDSCLGMEARPRGLKGSIISMLGNSTHLWMWDELSVARTLREVGFKELRRAAFGDSEEPMFGEVEEASRFQQALAFEASK
jgi:hypothetical protein